MSRTIRTRPLGVIGLVAALAAVVALQGSQAQDSKPVSEVLTPEKERTLQPKAMRVPALTPATPIIAVAVSFAAAPTPANRRPSGRPTAALSAPMPGTA